MWSEDNAPMNKYIATIKLNNAKNMAEIMSDQIDKYDKQMRQSNRSIVDAKIMIDNLNKELQSNGETEDSAANIHLEEYRLITLLQNTRNLTKRVDRMKNQKTLYDGRELFAIAAWRAAVANADEHEIMQTES